MASDTLPDPTAPRDARSEAVQLVGNRFDVRVLEPSPPAVDDGVWFADDPVGTVGDTDGRVVLGPVERPGTKTWADLAEGDPAVAAFARDRFLGPWKPMAPPPHNHVRTRLALHRLAAYVISPARSAANGKIGLRYTAGGFGTPFFGRDEQVRVQSRLLVHQRSGEVQVHPITTLRAAADVLGVDIDTSLDRRFDMPAAGDLDGPLDVDPEAAAFVGDWFGLAYSVLEQVRVEATPDEEPSRVQIWPEHFDAAFERGDEQAGRRAGLGASPGDLDHPDPYLYVSLWDRGRVPPGDFWNAPFGARLSYQDLLESGDLRDASLAFFRKAVDLLRP